MDVITFIWRFIENPIQKPKQNACDNMQDKIGDSVLGVQLFLIYTYFMSTTTFPMCSRSTDILWFSLIHLIVRTVGWTTTQTVYSRSIYFILS